MAKAKKLLLSERLHPLFMDNIDSWNLYKDAVKGGDDFINEDNLFTHRLEDSTDFDERLERAYYLNYCSVLPSIYNAFIFKEDIERPPDETLDVFRKSTDGRGTPISDFVAKIGFFSKIFGVMHVLVNMPDKNKERVTARFMKDNKIYPYCKLVYPTQLVDWSLDIDGNYRWVVIQSTYYSDEDPAIEREEKNHYHLITTKEWRIEDEKGAPADLGEGVSVKGTNELGIVPLVTVYHKDIDNDKVGESMIKDIVYINRAILNWSSCVDEQIERQTFSQLVIPDDGSLSEQKESGDDPLRKVGTASVWTFNADARHAPAFISPDTQNIQTIWKIIVDHIKEIFRIGGLIGSSDDMYVGSSGRARQIGFLSVNSILAETSRCYQKFENDISRIAYAYMGKNTSEMEEVKYPNSFDITSLDEMVKSSFPVMERNFSTTLNKTIQKNIARAALPLAPNSIRKTIEDEIESGDGIVEPVNARGDTSSEDENIRKTEDKAGGNNQSNAGKTFRTKTTVEKEKIEHRVEKE